MAARKKTKGPKDGGIEIDVVEIEQGVVRAAIIGRSPLIYNAMSAKVKMGLLYPHKKTAAEKQSQAKHNPPEEFRGTLYTQREGPTLLCFPAVAFKRALASVALDMGGAKKAQIERLTWAIGDKVPVWGIPELKMDVVRSADMNKTPDVRTRAILREWAAYVEIKYVMPALNETVVGNMLATAGMIRGIGDFRQQKGAGNYGQFELVNANDKDRQRIMKAGTRKAQEEAVANPLCYDPETEELLEWWREEFVARGHDRTAAKSNGHAEARS